MSRHGDHDGNKIENLFSSTDIKEKDNASRVLMDDTMIEGRGVYSTRGRMYKITYMFPWEDEVVVVVAPVNHSRLLVAWHCCLSHAQSVH